MVRYLGPFQTVCDDWNYWWTYLSEHISEATAFGFAQRVLLMQSNSTQTNNVCDQGATAPVERRQLRLAARAATSTCTAQTYGAAVDDQGNADCETGQRGYPQKLNYYDPQGRDLDYRPAHARRPGPDLRRPRPRARRRDVHPRTANRGRHARPSRGTTDAQATYAEADCPRSRRA